MLPAIARASRRRAGWRARRAGWSGLCWRRTALQSADATHEVRSRWKWNCHAQYAVDSGMVITIHIRVYHTQWYCAILHSTILYAIIPYRIILNYAILYDDMSYYFAIHDIHRIEHCLAFYDDIMFYYMIPRAILLVSLISHHNILRCSAISHYMMFYCIVSCDVILYCFVVSCLLLHYMAPYGFTPYRDILTLHHTDTAVCCGVQCYTILLDYNIYWYIVTWYGMTCKCHAML